MKKNYCDCCGKEVETWYVFSVVAQSESSNLGLCTSEAAAHNMQHVFASKRIYCKDCKNRALAILMPPKEEA